MADNTITTKVWYSNGETYTWPEQLPLAPATTPLVTPNVGISCVSGGSWARGAGEHVQRESRPSP